MTFDENFGDIHGETCQTDRVSTFRGVRSRLGKPSRRKLSRVSVESFQMEGWGRGCARACRSDFLRSGPSSFFFTSRPSSHIANPLLRQFALLPLYPSSKPSQLIFFPPRPYPLFLSFSSSLHLSASLLVTPYLCTEDTARGTRHIISLITPGDLF